VLAYGFVGVLVIGLVAMMTAGHRLKYEHSVPVAGGSAAPAAPAPSPDPPGLPPSADACADYHRLLAAAKTCTKVDAPMLDAVTQLASPTSTDPIDCQLGLDSLRAMLEAAACDIPAAAPAPAAPASGSAAEPAANVFFSDPIELEGGKNIELSFSAPIDNDWVYVAADIVQPDTGDVVGAEVDLEHWSGVDDGESWSEGDRTASAVIGPQPAGKYLLRLESQRGGKGSTDLSVQLHQGVFRARYWLWAMLVMLLPMAVVGLVSHSFEKRRWNNSNVGKAPLSMTLVVLVLASGIGLIAWAIIKAALSSRSSDD
jgi:hypothetical protein